MNPSDITSFDKKFDPPSMNNSIESATFEPEPTFEKTINDIKDNNLKVISSAATNSSAITSIEETFDPVCTNIGFEA